MIKSGAFLGVLLFSCAPVFAQSTQEMPLSAIDWLSESVEQPQIVATAPVPGTNPRRTPDPNEAPVANSATAPSVSVQPLSAPAPRALGLLGPGVTGFPADLWTGSDGATLTALLGAQETDTLPVVQNLIVTLAISEANPPIEPATNGAFFIARVDKLLDMGALEQAQAMLEMATPDTPALFQRWFDVTLLTGTEDRACRSLADKPDVAPTPAARIFCLARSGDWSAAALTLNTGRALGDIDADAADLLARFLDPDLFEGEADLTPPERMTPLTFRMFEAIGAAQTTDGLPRAFSHADLRDIVGWKAQLEAAERLARSGAISHDALMGLYKARVPAASGGPFERAAAVNSVERALDADDVGRLNSALARLARETRQVGVSVPVAEYFAPRLLEADIDGSERIVFAMLLVSDRYEDAALIPALADTDPFLAGVARGDLAGLSAARPKYPVVRDAFGAPPDTALIDMAANGRTGEAILRTIATLQQGIDGDTVAFGEGFATLRALGLEDVARRAALQYLLLP